MIGIEKPKIETAELSADGTYGKIIVEPLESGYGITLGNSLRRTLLSSLPGYAITSVKIDGKEVGSNSYVVSTDKDTSDNSNFRVTFIDLKKCSYKNSTDGSGNIPVTANSEVVIECTAKLNDNAVRVVIRGGRMTQEPLYPEGHPKRVEQESQGVSTDAPSHPRKKKKDAD